GFVAPDAGRVVIDDEVVDAVPASRRKIGMVFPDGALWPHLSAFETSPSACGFAAGRRRRWSAGSSPRCAGRPRADRSPEARGAFSRASTASRARPCCWPTSRRRHRPEHRKRDQGEGRSSVDAIVERTGGPTMPDDISPRDLKARIDQKQPLVLLDVREDWETKLGRL